MNAKAGAQERFTQSQDDLLALSHRIHAHPELGFEEEKAAAWIAETLSDAGFRVETGICDMPTAFVARAGSGPLHLAICAEYDGLPVSAMPAVIILLRPVLLGLALRRLR